MFRHGFMTRNNLRDQLSWLLRDISIALPAGPSLPSAPDSLNSQSEPSQTSATRSQLQTSAVPALSPADPTPTTRSTAVPGGPPPVADAVRPPRRLDTVAAEGEMARLTSAAKSKKPSLMVKEQPLPTPDSTSSIPPLQRAFSQLVDRKNARSAKKEPPATPAPAPTAAAIRSPVFSSDIYSNIDSIDLTSDDAAIKSSPNRDVRLWTEDCASRPEPLPKKSGKKRKSAEMSKVTPTPKKKQVVDDGDGDEDEFPDVHTLAELGSTRPKRSLSKGLPSSQNSPIRPRAAAASTCMTSVIEEHTVTETISRKKTRVRRAGGVAAFTEGSAVPVTAPIAAPLRSETSPRRPSTRGGVEVASAEEPHSTPGPSRKKSRKPRDSAVIQDSEDEFLTPQTEHISFFSCMSGSQSHHEDEESTQRAHESIAHVAKDRPSRTETPHRKRPRELSPTPQVDDAEPEKPVAHSSDSDGSTLIMDLFLRNPAVIGRKRQEIQTEMKKLSADYMRAISDNWPRDRKEQVKENRKRLSEQQKTLDTLGAEYEAHKALSERKNTLVKRLVEKFENGMDSPEDEDAAAEISHQMQEKEQSLRHLLVAAGMNNLELFEDVGEPVEPSNAPHHVVFGTQSPPHSAVSQMSRQASMLTSVNTDNAPQVIHQTQVPTKGPPVFSRMGEYGDSILAPQPPPFPREPRPLTKEPGSRAPAIKSATPGVAFFDGLLDDDDDDMMELCDNPPLPRRPQPQAPPPPVRPAAGSRPASRWAGEEVDYFSDDEDSMVQFAESLERESSSRPSLSTQASRSALLETSGNTRIVPRSRTEPTRKDKKVDSAPKPSISRDLMKHPWSNDVRRALKDHFRMSGFRHNQLEAINATLSGKDAFVLMPTGGGKSLCYQLPAVIDTGKTRGVTIVVSPLLSLMQDQIDHLKALHIVARQYSSDVDKAQRDMILDALRSSRNPENMVRLLYVTPEMIGKSQAFLNALDKVYGNNKLARIVIDEAHCVSQWGHDFRPDYKTLGEVRRRYPKVPVMALTATATPHVIVDIKHNLSIPECEIFSQSFNRPNLFYDIRSKGKNIVQTIADLIQSDHEGETGIVYTLSRKSAETIAKKLRDQSGISAHHYHAKMETDEKTDVQRKWQSGQIKVVVATIAFGMGIDKPDVRFVVHHTLPKSLEGYYQETGRAGRDGGQSHCYLYFGYGDINSLRKMINDGEGNQQQKDRQSQMLNRVVDFCEDKRDCRREGILRYFGEKFDRASCNKTCDNCRNGGQFELVDHTETAIAALRVIQGRRQTTPKQCADILLGRGAPKDEERPEHYGAAKPLKEHVVLNILYRLTAEEALEEINKPIKGGMVATYCQVSRVVSYTAGRIWGG